MKSLRELVTFVPNKTEPIHNWFYYKEGFSRGLVDFLLDEFHLQGPVFDPFCGVGTTLLTCQQRGIAAIGMDISPLAVLASRVKTRSYNIAQLDQTLQTLETLSPVAPVSIPVDSRIRKLFYRNALETIWFYKNEIESIEDPIIRDFFYLALIDTTGQAANVQKVGGSLRKTKKPDFPVRETFFKKVRQMRFDLAHEPVRAVESEVLEGDARFHTLSPESIGSVITSPPYLNKIEYTRIYGIELGLFFDYHQKGLRAFVGDNPRVEVSVELARLPLIAQAYFADLKRVLANLWTALIPGGTVCIIVAGGCLPNGVVNSPQIIGKLGQLQGFILVQNMVCRDIDCKSPHGRPIGHTSENIVMLQKPS